MSDTSQHGGDGTPLGFPKAYHDHGVETVAQTGDDTYSITMRDGTVHTVDLEAWHCSCGECRPVHESRGLLNTLPDPGTPRSFSNARPQAAQLRQAGCCLHAAAALDALPTAPCDNCGSATFEVATKSNRAETVLCVKIACANCHVSLREEVF